MFTIFQNIRHISCLIVSYSTEELEMKMRYIKCYAKSHENGFKFENVKVDSELNLKKVLKLIKVIVYYECNASNNILHIML